MSATITVSSGAGDQRTVSLPAGEVHWLTAGGRPAATGAGQLCVFATAVAVWAVIAPAADAIASARGRSVMGGLLDLLEAPIAIGASTWTARADVDGPRRVSAPASSRCPVCHLAIEPGAEVFACSCGVVTDSRFCATGGALEPQCFACGAALQGGSPR